MKYVYILLICLILFYILSRFFEKYYSQENFDPSLVPVSSIITLAKVAQKIVDGNGTLTNPANLNIGTTNARGNLLVTGDTTTNGNSTTNGNKQIDGTLAVTGATNIDNILSVTGNTTVSGTLGVTGATTVGGTLGVTGATTLTGGVTGNTKFAAATIGTTGTPATTTNLTVNGATAIIGNVTLPSSHILTTDPTKGYFLVNNSTNTKSVLSIGQAGDAYFSGPTTIGTTTTPVNLNVNGTLKIGNITLSDVNGELKISSGISASSITSSGNVTATGIRNGGGFILRGPSTNGYDYSSIIRDNDGRIYAIDGLYGGSTDFGKSGGGGPCNYSSSSNCIGPGKTAGII